MKESIETKIIIQQRIRKTEEVVGELKKIRKLSREKFLEDQQVQYASMYAMIVGIEAICDIGNHILAKFFNRPAETYQDIILGLGETGVIPKSLAKKSKSMTDFRNLLIHVYLKIDPEKVYENLQKAPEEFTQFCRYFLKFLERDKKPRS